MYVTATASDVGEHTLQVSVKAKPKFLLQAETDAERDEWIKSITAVRTASPPGGAVVVVFEGRLTQLPTNTP